jgi:hypothetical protein
MRKSGLPVLVILLATGFLISRSSAAEKEVKRLLQREDIENLPAP